MGASLKSKPNDCVEIETEECGQRIVQNNSENVWVANAAWNEIQNFFGMPSTAMATESVGCDADANDESDPVFESADESDDDSYDDDLVDCVLNEGASMPPQESPNSWGEQVGPADDDGSVRPAQLNVQRCERGCLFPENASIDNDGGCLFPAGATGSYDVHSSDWSDKLMLGLKKYDFRIKCAQDATPSEVAKSPEELMASAAEALHLVSNQHVTVKPSQVIELPEVDELLFHLESLDCKLQRRAVDKLMASMFRIGKIKGSRLEWAEHVKAVILAELNPTW